MTEINSELYLNVCPVCGNRFMSEYFEFEICPRCRWEDDPHQSENPDELGANGDVTLRQAQDNFEKTGRAKPYHNNSSKP